MIKNISKECINSFCEKWNMTEFYERAAQELGFEVNDDSVYDCRRINVSPDILSSWINRYEEIHGKRNIQQLMTCLLFLGPKAMGYLTDDEVEILPGFITEREERTA